MRVAIVEASFLLKISQSALKSDGSYSSSYIFKLPAKRPLTPSGPFTGNQSIFSLSFLKRYRYIFIFVYLLTVVEKKHYRKRVTLREQKPILKLPPVL